MKLYLLLSLLGKQTPQASHLACQSGIRAQHTSSVCRGTACARDPTQQFPMQPFQQVAQIPGRLSPDPMAQLCNNNVSATENLPCVELRRRIVSRIEEKLRTSGKPNVFMKSAGELESLAYSKAKTRTEYLRYIAHILAKFSYSTPTVGQQQHQLANMTTPQFPTLFICEPQMTSTVELQDASQQASVHPAQNSFQMADCVSRVPMTAPCSTNLAKDADLPSTAFQQKLVSKIDAQLGRVWNPTVAMKSREEIESQVCSDAESKVDYLYKFSRVEVEARQQHQRTANMATQSWMKPQSSIPSTACNQEEASVTQPSLISPSTQAVPGSLSQVTGPCNSQSVTTENWHSIAFRRKVISKMKEKLRRWKNPNILMKSPEEIESRVYSEAKTKAVYLTKLSRLVYFEAKARQQQLRAVR